MISTAVMDWFKKSASSVVSAAEALPGRSNALVVSLLHTVTHRSVHGPFDGLTMAMFGMGCFWGAERLLWKTPGVKVTSVGYAGGHTPNPTYREVCSGRTGHAEVVRVAFGSNETTYEALLKVFWESHDPTQGMRQGNDVGTQYRSAIYCYGAEQLAMAERTRDMYQAALAAQGFSAVTSEIVAAPVFYFAEDDHQQYLDKNPDGYCGIGGTGVTCPIRR
jgi:peptide-methionine (S)-S-oxide reductase